MIFIFSFKKNIEINIENKGTDNIKAVNSGKSIFFKATKPKYGKGIKINERNKGI